MAVILPQNAPPPADDDTAGLEATLATLPDEWLMLLDRQIGGAGGPHADFVLVHPEIGVALVNLGGAAPHAAAAALRRMLAAEQPFGPGDHVPIVVVAVPPDDIPAIGDLLADAFDAAPPCEVADPSWTRLMTDLLLHAEDAAMAPLLQPPPHPPQPQPQPALRLESPEFDDRPALAEPAPGRRGTWATAAALAFVLLGGGGALAYFALAPAPDAVVAADVPLPPVLPPKPAPAVPAQQTAAAAATTPNATAMPMPSAPAPQTPATATPAVSAPPSLPAAEQMPPPPQPKPEPVVAPLRPTPALPIPARTDARTDIASATPAPADSPKAGKRELAPLHAARAEPAKTERRLHRPRPPIHKVAAAPKPRPKPANDEFAAEAPPPSFLTPPPGAIPVSLPPQDAAPQEAAPAPPAEAPPVALVPPPGAAPSAPPVSTDAQAAVEGSDEPASPSAIGLASDVPFVGPPAASKPVMLLPPVGPPADMPQPP